MYVYATECVFRRKYRQSSISLHALSLPNIYIFTAPYKVYSPIGLVNKKKKKKKEADNSPRHMIALVDDVQRIPIKLANYTVVWTTMGGQWSRLSPSNAPRHKKAHGKYI